MKISKKKQEERLAQYLYDVFTQECLTWSERSNSAQKAWVREAREVFKFIERNKGI